MSKTIYEQIVPARAPVLLVWAPTRGGRKRVPIRATRASAPRAERATASAARMRCRAIAQTDATVDPDPNTLRITSADTR